MSDASPVAPAIAADAGPRLRLGQRLWRGAYSRLTLYYLVLGLGVILAQAIAPQLLDRFPVGGVDRMQGFSESDDLVDTFLGTDDSDAIETAITQTIQKFAQFDEARDLIYGLIAATLLMIPTAWAYKLSREKGDFDRSLIETILILPQVIAGIVLIVQNSLALAFALAGVAAGVTFRRSLETTGDSLFIFIIVAVGIAAGIRALEIAAIVTIFFNYAVITVHKLDYGACPVDGPPPKRPKGKKKLPTGASDDQSLSRPGDGLAPPIESMR